MREVFVLATNMITSLGFTTLENFQNMTQGKSGIGLYDNDTIFSIEDYKASFVSTLGLEKKAKELSIPEGYSRLEKMFIISVTDALEQCSIDTNSDRTLFLFSSTKGNIDLLEPENAHKFPKERIHLWKMAEVVKDYFHNSMEPIVLSNACISGVLAIVIGSRLIQRGQFDNVVVIGGDIITEFVLSGFQSLKSLDPSHCKPFNKNRKGLTLGEGSASIILSKNHNFSKFSDKIVVLGGVSTNDANHISGPSRTGEGLYRAIHANFHASNIEVKDIDFVSSHGTGTLYNDEMEANAFFRAGLSNTPIHSLKGYFGHTLGAAGVLEIAASIESLKTNTLLATKGYIEKGVSKNISISSEMKELYLNCFLKTASGFGGCNSSVIIKKK